MNKSQTVVKSHKELFDTYGGLNNESLTQRPVENIMLRVQVLPLFLVETVNLYIAGSIRLFVILRPIGRYRTNVLYVTLGYIMEFYRKRLFF